MARGVRCAAVMALIVATTTSVIVRGQEPSERLQFQVASVKANRSGESSLRFEAQPGGRFLAVNIPLKQLIRAAYTLQLYQIVNAPPWVDAERFDISAIADRDLTPTAPWTPGQFAPVQLMIQSLLADRFNLIAHVEMRPSQVYSLVRDQPERSHNAQFAPAATHSSSMQIATGRLTARSMPLAQFAELLSQLTGRVVTDATGLTGGFDVDLRWNPDLQQSTSDAPSIFTAVQEQLGLKLVRSSAPVEHLVIDAIARPDSD
jgi:bla regulator protein blaR1